MRDARPASLLARAFAHLGWPAHQQVEGLPQADVAVQVIAPMTAKALLSLALKPVRELAGDSCPFPRPGGQRGVEIFAAKQPQ